MPYAHGLHRRKTQGRGLGRERVHAEFREEHRVQFAFARRAHEAFHAHGLVHEVVA